MRQGLYVRLSDVPLSYDLLASVNTCTTERNAVWPRKKLLALILRPLNERRGDGHIFCSP